MYVVDPTIELNSADEGEDLGCKLSDMGQVLGVISCCPGQPGDGRFVGCVSLGDSTVPSA